MKIARALALLALLLIVGSAALFAVGALSDAAMKLTLLLATVLWFATAPRWLRGGTD